MEDKMMRKFKWFWAWQDEAEEEWLREMSNKGWHLKHIGFPTIYTLESGEPVDYVYRLDYRSYWKMEKEDYLQLFRDSGWEYVEEMAGWLTRELPFPQGVILMTGTCLVPDDAFTLNPGDHVRVGVGDLVLETPVA